MPDMEGIEFLRIMRSKKIRIPVLIMSGNPIGIDFSDQQNSWALRENWKNHFQEKSFLKLSMKCCSNFLRYVSENKEEK